MTLVVECGILALIFGAIYAYAFGTREKRGPGANANLLCRYQPPVQFALKYRGASGVTTHSHVRVLHSFLRTGGQVYLFALCGKPRRPRTFRVDRIVRIATVNGEVIDTMSFLTGRLGIPPQMCRANLKVAAGR